MRTIIDMVKIKLAGLHCDESLSCYIDDILNRSMVVAFLRDWHDNYSTIAVSLLGSPPKAFALLLCKEWSPRRDKKIEIHTIILLSTWGEQVKRIVFDNPVELDIAELIGRKDVVLMNNPFDN